MVIKYKEIKKRNLNKDKKTHKNDTARFLYGLRKQLYKNRMMLTLTSILLLLIISFFDAFKIGILLTILLVSNIILSYMAKSIPRYNTAFELIMFSTILSGVSYGVKIGIFVGIIFSILYYFAAGRMSFYIVVLAPLYAMFGFIAGIYPVTNIFVFGMICTISYSLISSILVSLLFNANLDRALVFIFVNGLFNLVMFKYIAPIFLLLM